MREDAHRPDRGGQVVDLIDRLGTALLGERVVVALDRADVPGEVAGAAHGVEKAVQLDRARRKIVDDVDLVLRLLISASTRWVPMNPNPPVTRIRGIGATLQLGRRPQSPNSGLKTLSERRVGSQPRLRGDPAREQFRKQRVAGRRQMRTVGRDGTGRAAPARNASISGTNSRPRCAATAGRRAAPSRAGRSAGGRSRGWQTPSM